MGTGRPRSFDPDVALERALRVFWAKGFEGASLSDLTRAMGINRPSLYAAFGNKEALFLKAVERYDAGPAAYFTRVLALPDARSVALELLRASARAVTEPGRPAGCLAVQGALSCSEEAEIVRSTLADARRQRTLQLAARFAAARAEGDLPATLDTGALAGLVMSLSHGMAVQAAGGASRAELLAEVALLERIWPCLGAGAGEPG